MADYARPLKKILKAADCYLVRQPTGSHEIWYSPLSELEVSVPRKIKSRHTANDILKEAGLTKEF